MYCKNCGEQISEHAEICIHCGVRVKNASGEDKPNWAVNIITLCCVPLVGLILFFVWKDEKPIAAKSALMFFFINIGIIILFYIAMLLIGFLSY
ncbi:zinc ribbon domain-containing protein [Lysinibacillus sp. FSL M8-0216]|uniref:zinc-ribbon domain-containing protein n=1 Tax=Lysinibacillus TaxID=400634 RepID=UPI000D39CA81|nr:MULTISPECIES: zinc ribbon domain-containing protein [Lysinibacillus]MCG7434358.1 zinc ribbon domain-containing protein [Lysinibacillus fusiformis]MED4671514.1 zinc ribbon domain-containing protein [Lysinibacillus fusiformis]NOG27287.1 zinc ribbon domain-containing protein [Lysinibacillus fusiformis]QAS55044.1 zinc ribbon domain-containing protein [Lysinibacillus sphaericus]RDV33263.1 zinc ribbon domain-containing protein [Lysinibacillus fusiformis]